MDRIIVVQEKVEDLYGLYVDLRKGAFDVKNVGADAKGTYVYVGDGETKDPVPVVRSWVGKKAPEPSLSLKKKRTKEFEEIIQAEKRAEEVRKAEELKKLEEGSGNMELIESNTEPGPQTNGGVAAQVVTGPITDESGNVIGELLQGPVVSKESILKRIWKKLF